MSEDQKKLEETRARCLGAPWAEKLTSLADQVRDYHQVDPSLFADYLELMAADTREQLL